MRAIKVYCPPGVEPPLYAFIDALDGKLKATLYLFRSLRSSCYGSLNGALDLILALQGTVVNELRDRRYLMMLSLCFVGGLDHVRIQYRITTVGDAALLQKVIQPLYSLIF